MNRKWPCQVPPGLSVTDLLWTTPHLLGHIPTSFLQMKPYRCLSNAPYLAIAPDQQLPDLGITTNGQYVDLSKPFWAQYAQPTEPPFKRRKRSLEDDTSVLEIEIDADFLAP